MATDFEALAAGLRAWAAGSRTDEAAVELLVWHEDWLRRADFTAACVREGWNGVISIHWRTARTFADVGPVCSTTQLNVLRAAAAIGGNEFGLSGLGHIHSYKVAEAFAAALGLRIEGLIPEPGHNHPDFIPGTPEDCGACAREARDEGRRQ